MNAEKLNNYIKSNSLKVIEIELGTVTFLKDNIFHLLIKSDIDLNVEEGFF